MKMQDLVDHLGVSIRPWLDRPFLFYGHSLGALTAFEVAKWLRRMEAPMPKALCVAASRAPQLPWPHSWVHGLDDLTLLQEVEKRYGGVPALVMENEELRELLTPGLRADMAVVETYACPAEAPLDRPVFVFGGIDDAMTTEPALRAWQAQTTRGFRLTMLPGGHLFQQTHAGVLLDAIADAASSSDPIPMDDPAESQEKKEPADEAIAIVGFGCRLPGAPDVESFWRLLVDGREGTSEYAQTRSPALDRIYSKDADGGEKAPSSRGGFLSGLETFDAAFFGLSPREASYLDPQQRLLLEVAWEATEDAGIPLETLSHRTTGVFVGIWANDFEHLLYDGASEYDIYKITGAARFPGSGRLSYFLNATGPSVTVDTACSSSLVAVHMARRALLNGECDVAFAGGVNVLLRPEITLGFAKAGMLSSEGRCKFGDASADGFVRSEGAVVTVLKRLSDAQRDRDEIYAVIRGSAVNNDGQGSGLLMKPSVEGQEKLIHLALADARVSADQLSYIEAHGTGTPAGDPVELEAIGNVLRSAGRHEPCPVGSVKTNIGHTEGAAGLAGLMKVALSLKHQILPASLHFRQGNPAVPWDRLPLRIPGTSALWPRGETPRLAGVSAFGITGTNAHAILEEAPAPAPEPQAIVNQGAHLVLLSAQSPEGLQSLAQRYIDRAGTLPSLADLSYTAAVRRTHLQCRLAVVAESEPEFIEKLKAFTGGDSSLAARKIAFVFPGQGSQWIGMGRELLRSSPVFREAIERCDRAIERETGWRVSDVLDDSASEAAFEQIEVIQPVLFAMSVALAAQWRNWGIEPQAVIGHSMGEVAAACVAGAITLEDAAAIICRRSRLMKRIHGMGAMALVELRMDEVARRLESMGGQIAIAASNGDSSTVVSGDRTAVETLLAKLEAEEIFARRIKVDVASHSAQVDPLLGELRSALQSVKPRDGSIPLYSTVRSGIQTGAGLDADYWANNLRYPVMFAAGVRKLLDDGFDGFIEVSPHPLLTGSIQAMLAQTGRKGFALGSLKREAPEQASLLESMGSLYCAGYPVDWSRQYPHGGRRVSLPGYPFERERLWPELSEGRLPQKLVTSLLGREVNSSADPDSSIFESELSGEAPAYLADHLVRDQIVLPASAYCEMAIAAAQKLFGAGPVTLTNVSIDQAIILPPTGGRKVQVTTRRQGPGIAQFEVRAIEEDGTWALCATGSVGKQIEPSASLDSLEQIRVRCSTEIGVDALYQGLSRAGLPYGPAFRCAEGIWEGSSEYFTLIRLSGAAGPEGGHFFHPSILDAGLTSIVHAAIGWTGDEQVWVPVSIPQLRLFRTKAGSELFAHFTPHLQAVDDGTFGGDLRFFSPEGELVVELNGVAFRRLGSNVTPGRDCLFAVRWEEQPILPAKPDTPCDWLLFSDAGGVASRLAGVLAGKQQSCLQVTAGLRFEQHAQHWQVRPDHPEDFDRLFLDPRIRGSRGVIYAWTLDAASGPTTSKSLGAARLWTVTAPSLLLQALIRAGLPQSPRIWLLTAGVQATGNGPQQKISLEQSPAWGLGRVLALEHPEFSPTSVDLSAAPTADELEVLAGVLNAEPPEDQLAVRGMNLYAARLGRWDVPAATVPADSSESYQVRIRQPGLLETLELQASAPCPARNGEVRIRVESAGLNFRDVLTAMALVSGSHAASEMTLGMECAGRVVDSGDSVLAIASPFETGTLRSHVTVPECYVRRIPLGWSVEQASAQLIAFLTSWYALEHLARIKRGDRVLIHSAAGGVGMAAIQIALRAGAEVFATAGSEVKRQLVRGLGASHVFDSRTLDFAAEVLAATGGRGVDIVLNSLAGPFLAKSIEVLAPYGRFFELGKRDIQNNNALALGPFLRNLSFSVVDLADMLQNRREYVSSMLDELMMLFAAGELQPLTVESFAASNAAEAFQKMAHARHTGKLALRFDECKPALAPSEDVLFRADATYLITGGLGGVGFQVARWLVDHGARNLALVGRRAPSTGMSRAISALVSSKGVRVEVFSADVSRAREVQALIEKLPDLRGVFHAAAVIDDDLLRNLDPLRVEAVLAPKVQGAWNLHQATLSLPLDYFVLFSSVAAVSPQPGHGSYAAANSFLDALARERARLGLPATSLNWGGWRGLGLANEEGTQRSIRGYARRGMSAMPVETALEALNLALRGKAPNLVVTRFDAARMARSYAEEGLPPLFRKLAITANISSASDSPRSSFLEALQAAPIGAERRELLEDHLKEQASRVLRLSAARIDRNRPFGQMGLDSLMSVEYVNRLRASLSIALPATSVFNHPTIARLTVHIAQRLQLSLEATLESAEPGRKESLISAEIHNLSEEEAIRLLVGGGGAA